MSEQKRDWLIWEGRNELWWRHDGQGYTRDFLQAGLYTEEEAKRIHSKPGDTRRDKAVHLSDRRELIEVMRAGLKLIDEQLAEEQEPLHSGDDEHVDRLTGIIAGLEEIEDEASGECDASSSTAYATIMEVAQDTLAELKTFDKHYMALRGFKVQS